MPTATPADLTPDAAGGYAAADACRALASVLHRSCEARAAETERATVDWLGPHRELFGRRLADFQAESVALVAQLRRAAASIERAVSLAEAGMGPGP